MDRIDLEAAASRFTRPAKPTAAQVDSKADELVGLYNAKEYRPWYCRVIYTLGIDKVERLQSKAKEGRNPARLFSYLAKEAMGDND